MCARLKSNSLMRRRPGSSSKSGPPTSVSNICEVESKDGWALLNCSSHPCVLTQRDSSSERQFYSSVRDTHLYLLWDPSRITQREFLQDGRQISLRWPCHPSPCRERPVFRPTLLWSIQLAKMTKRVRLPSPKSRSHNIP